MKKGIVKAGLVMGLLIVTGSFISCDKKAPVKKKQVIADNIENISTETVEKEIMYRKPVVFITGIDQEEQNFYKSARSYFLDKQFEVVDYAFSLQEVFTWLNKNYDGNTYGEIHIVTNHNQWEGLSMETLIKGDRVTTESLRKAITLGELPVLKDGIKKGTKVVFHSQGLGENTSLMKTLKDAFVADEVPSVVASPYVDIFGGEFSEHYLAKPYYVFYPYSLSPGKIDLSKEIARKYPEEKEIDWYDALNNYKERYVGDAYTYRFSIPVKWEFDYTNSDNEVPNFKSPEEIMDWIEQDQELLKVVSKYNIPLEKFRWRSAVKGNKLIIKGKVTVLCVLKPLIKPYGDLQHVEPDTENLRLYAMK
ncbi:hypothetical protein AAON49_06745 [Pseudotenacibaculum sp. MALMAid0570]|uniref:hypothetical protein n=1 Tax=Pseudotenacibaculum sp. MALMAid0570 TaxID=3143938 RepID=UPI0032DFA640